MRAAGRLLTMAVWLAAALPAVGQAPTPMFPFHPTYEGNPQSTWLRWWEANQGEYLPPPPRRPPVPVGVRSYVEMALIRATASPLPATRAAAALALGRVGVSDGAVQRLAELTTDTDPRVKANAWIALGLLDSPAARDFLLQKRTLDESDTIAWVTALGLLDRPDDRVIGALKWFASQNKSPSAQQMALRSIWTLNPPDCRDLMLLALNNTDSPDLAAVAIQGLGAVHDPRDVPLLLDLLDHTGLAMKLGVERALAARASLIAGGNNTYRYYVALSRTSAAMALSHYDDLDAAALHVGIPVHTVRVAMDRSLFFDENNLDEYYKDLTVLNLGRLGDSDALPGLIQVFDGFRLDPGTLTANGTPLQLSTQGLSHSYRMFGALALGLHVRQLMTQQAAQSRAEAAGGRPDPWAQQRIDVIDNVSRYLADRLGDPSEWSEVRAASALALGLTGRRENGDLIVQYAHTIGQAGDLVPGFSMLALGMLNDPRTVSGADRLLGPPVAKLDIPAILQNDVSAVAGMDRILTPAAAARPAAAVGTVTRTPMETLLSRRAALLGLSLVSDPAALPPLHGSWGYEYSISQAAATALAERGDLQDTEALVQILHSSRTTVAPVLAAWTLGEMFDHNGRLKRLTRDTDFLSEDLRHWGQWYASPQTQAWEQWDGALITTHDLWPIYSIADEFLYRTGIAFETNPAPGPPLCLFYPSLQFQMQQGAPAPGARTPLAPAVVSPMAKPLPASGTPKISTPRAISTPTTKPG